MSALGFVLLPGHSQKWSLNIIVYHCSKYKEGGGRETNGQGEARRRGWREEGMEGGGGEEGWGREGEGGMGGGGRGEGGGRGMEGGREEGGKRMRTASTELS